MSVWRKSSRSTGQVDSDCVEVAVHGDSRDLQSGPFDQLGA